MPLLSNQTLIGAMQGVFLALAFRLLPFVVSAAWSQALTRALRVVIASGYVLLLLGLSRWVPHACSLLGWLAVAWLYLLGATLMIYALSESRALQALTRPALFCLNAVLFVLLPGVLLGGAPGAILLLATGFELMFSGFSYCVEPSAREARRELRNCLFFLLVNPTLVYVARGVEVGPPAWRSGSARRVLQGISMLLLQAVIGPWLALAGLGFGGAAWNWSGVASEYPLFALALGSSLVVQYVGHSGLASLQIGLMGLLGWRVPERYDYPFLARDPLDLWRRWNMYLGAWLSRYVFFPLAVRWETRARQRGTGKAAALLVTFAVAGLTHELVGYALALTLPGGAVLGFLLCGLAIVLWFGLGRTAAFQYLGRVGRSWPTLRTLAGGATTSTLLLLFGWVALPALAGFGLPAPLQRWLGF